MTTSADRIYLIEKWVRSNLRSHEGKPFTFELPGAIVTIRPPAANDSADGFVAETRLRGDGLLSAERAAHDAVTALLDVLAYEMRVSGLVVRAVRSQVESSGPIRRCVAYGYESRPRSFFLGGRQAEEMQRIIRDQLEATLRRALYWLRWTYSAKTAPEAFLFAWMALERLAGEQKIAAHCDCGEPVTCPKHGERYYSTVPRASVKAILERHGVSVADIKTLLEVRNPLVHGGWEHNFMQRADMHRTLPALTRAIEEELRDRLKAAGALHVSPLAGSGDAILGAHCEYRTAFPGDAFPPDCPTFAEVEEYQEAVRQGREHPKIINILSWPPNW